MKPIMPCLWFGGNAGEAVKFYVSVFKNSKIHAVTRYGKGMHMPEGEILTIIFTLNGQRFMALNAKPPMEYNESVSFVVHCKNQKEIDSYSKKLTKGGGKLIECSWLKDRYGIRWQIVPQELPQMMKHPRKFEAVLREVMKMKVLNVKTLKKAYANG